MQILAQDEEAPAKTVSAVSEAAELFIPLGDLVDVAKETARLTKERDSVQRDIERGEAKLNNPGFTSKAPAQLVEQEREKLAEKLTSLTARLNALDEQILKLENTDIVGIVRENGLTIEQLAALMEMLEKRPTAALPDEYRKTEEFVDEE